MTGSASLSSSHQAQPVAPGVGAGPVAGKKNMDLPNPKNTHLPGQARAALRRARLISDRSENPKWVIIQSAAALVCTFLPSNHTRAKNTATSLETFGGRPPFGQSTYPGGSSISAVTRLPPASGRTRQPTRSSAGAALQGSSRDRRPGAPRLRVCGQVAPRRLQTETARSRAPG